MKCGFSFLSTYAHCRRKFWFKYVLNYVPEEISPQISKGRFVHEGIGKFFSGEEIELDNEDPDANAMLSFWLNEWGDDKEKYRPILVDDFFEVDIIEGVTLIAKPDRIMFDLKTGDYDLFETKTTGYSLDKVTSDVRNCDQVTVYKWAWDLKNPGKKISRIFSDTIYKRSSVMKVGRSRIYRTDEEMKDFELGLKNQVAEIKDRYDYAMNADGKGKYVFFRSPKCDQGSQFRCEYGSICRTLIGTENPPIGFTWRERIYE